ncbi:MAG TPA: hydrogenase formation protein HypD [Polyangiaceae bacterium]
MKFVDEFRDPARTAIVVEALKRVVTRPWTLMEICGGQTHTIMKYGIDQLLPEGVRLVHGPGCPVCVTPIELIDQAVAIAQRPSVILASFGDMLRVPGSTMDLLTAKSQGADVRMVYSPLDAVKLAQQRPDRQVVFFAVGFETTAPPNAMAVAHAARLGLSNFSILSSHVLVPPAISALMEAKDNVVQGFLAAGHVCTVMGTSEYEPLAERHRIPIVVTGFEPLDLLEGIYLTIQLLERGQNSVEIQYGRSVSRNGNPAARAVMFEVFEICDRPWRGIGIIPQSGLRLSPRYAQYDAAKRMGVEHLTATESARCRAGDVLRGVLRPNQCPAFGRDCTPEHPLGAPMVSSEGACAAYFRYGRARTFDVTAELASQAK